MRCTVSDKIGSRGAAASVLMIGALALIAVGCGETGDPSIIVTPTGAPAATNTPTPTSTPTEGGEPAHVEIHFGSTAAGGGALAVADIEPEYKVPKADCVGGTGDACTGGTIVYVGISPGLDPIEEAGDSLFPLSDATTLLLQVIALEDGLSFQYGDVQVSTGGESVVLGTTPDLHADFEWQITAPASVPVHNYTATFKLTTTSPSAYQPSDEFTVLFAPTEASD